MKSHPLGNSPHRGVTVAGHLCLVMVLLTVGFASAAGPAAVEKPNIIYIVSDDLGYGDLGCYGQKRVKTPRLDRMAREGLRFTDHYAGHTLCRHSRLVFLTGYHTGNTPIADAKGKADRRLQR